MLAMLIVPIILILFAGTLLISTISTSFINVARGGMSTYDEITFQKYANQQYEAEFENTVDYEDNLMIVFLVEDEEYYDYAFIAWAGDHIDDDIKEMFGDEQTQFGRAIQNSAINSDTYMFSLDSGIASVMNKMEKHVTNLNRDSSYIDFCKNTDAGREYKSHVTNKTSISITESTVNNSLEEFTEKTGIPVVVVIEDIEEVFPKQIRPNDILVVIVLSGIIIYAIVMIVKAIKKSKEKNEDDGSYKGSSEKIDFDNF